MESQGESKMEKGVVVEIEVVVFLVGLVLEEEVVEIEVREMVFRRVGEIKGLKVVKEVSA